MTAWRISASLALAMVPPCTLNAVLLSGFAAARPVTGFNASGLARGCGRAAAWTRSNAQARRIVLCLGILLAQFAVGLMLLLQLSKWLA